MAKFNVTYYEGYGALGSSDKESLTSADILRICRAGADVLLQRLRDWLETNTHDANAAIRGRLAASLTAKEYPATGSVIVSPTGKHHGKSAGPKTRAAGYHRPKTGQGSSNNRKRHGMASATSAAEVGYYLENGTPRMRATHWMEITVEAAQEEVLAAMDAETTAVLTEKGLL